MLSTVTTLALQQLETAAATAAAATSSSSSSSSSSDSSSTSSSKRMLPSDDSAAIQSLIVQHTTTTTSQQQQQQRQQRERCTRAAPVKHWYKVQKERKRALEDEIRWLQAQRRRLSTDSPSAAAERAAVLLKRQKETEMLRRAVQHQQMRVVRAEAALSGLSTAACAPFGKYIHLGVDWVDRAATLTRLKPVILRDAERYVMERLQFLDPTLEYSQMSQAKLPNGDLMYAGLDVVQLDQSHTSVKKVYDAMYSFLFNVEIAWTETIGELMLREDDFECGDPNVMSQRLLRARRSGPPIESSSIVFSKLYSAGERRRYSDDSGAIGDSAVIVVDFVDKDELHPYRPEERLRDDIIGVIVLNAYRRKKNEQQQHDNDATDDSLAIVARRAFFGRMHSSSLPVQACERVEEFSSTCNFWSKTMYSTVGNTVRRGGVVGGAR